MNSNIFNIEQCSKVLKNTFGYSNFRANQENAIEAILKNQDLLMILPTGGGKSICFQLPALIKDGLTIVISPLIALMYDQVSALKEKGIKAETIASIRSESENEEILNNIAKNGTKILYVSPERIATNSFIQFLKTQNIAMFVIDEAHCISEWGHEFRDDYRKLNQLKIYFPNTQIVAFTATATLKVADDIINSLQLKTPKIIKSISKRDNLYIDCQERDGKGYSQIIEYINMRKSLNGIIYTFSRNESEEIQKYLEENKISSLFYHAGMNSAHRTRVHNAFLNDEVQVVVATVAFGMGIDKSNIRFIIHTSLPKSIENYYQEIGRAGRDGLDAEALLLYSMSDIPKRKNMIESDDLDWQYKSVAKSKLNSVIRFVIDDVCKHRYIAQYFGDEISDCMDKCSYCVGDDLEQKENFTTASQKLLSCIYKTGQSFGLHHVVDVLVGSENQKVLTNKHNTLSVYGIGSELSKEEWLSLGNMLVGKGKINIGNYGVLEISESGTSILKGQETVLISPKKIYKKLKSTKELNKKSIEISDEFTRLKELRLKLAKNENYPPYIICNDKTLFDISKLLPTTKTEFLAIDGLGEKKYEKYGDEFISLCEELKQKTYKQNNTAQLEAPKQTNTSDKPKSQQKDTKISQTLLDTFELIKQGHNAIEISQTRELSLTTIIQHLKKLEEIGYVEKAIVNQETIKAIDTIPANVKDWINSGLKLAEVEELYYFVSLARFCSYE